MTTFPDRIRADADGPTAAALTGTAGVAYTTSQ